MYIIGGQEIVNESPYAEDVLVFNLTSHKWKTLKLKGDRSASSRLYAAVWYEPSLRSILVYGGQIWPDAKKSTASLNQRPGGAQSCDVFSRLDLDKGEWRILPHHGDPPSFLQETTVIPLTSGGVILWGGFCEHEGMGIDKVRQVDEFVQKINEPPTLYRKTAFRWDPVTSYWRRLLVLGNKITLNAQSWAYPSDDGFVVGGGYGLASDDVVNATNLSPRALRSRFSCRIWNPLEEETASTDAWGTSPVFNYSPCIPADIQIGIIPESSSDDDKKDLLAPPLSEEQLKIEIEPRSELHHIWLSKVPAAEKGGFRTSADSYRGPLSDRAKRAIEKHSHPYDQAGFKMLGIPMPPDHRVVDAKNNRVIMSRPTAEGPLFTPLPMTGKERACNADALYDVRKACEVDQVAADAVVARLLETPTTTPKTLTLRIDVAAVVPAIWREIRVKSTMRLKDFDDQVLRPVLGYDAGHAHAWKYNDSWLGPKKSSAIDMAHVPLFIGALGDDRAVTVGHVLAKPGDVLHYVWDLGDFWLHRITVLDVDEMKEPTAVLLDGQGAGVPEDCGGPIHFTKHARILVGVDPHPSGVKNRPIKPGSPMFWDFLNCEFRKFNLRTVAYHPLRFDIDDARRDLTRSLRFRRKKRSDTHKAYTINLASEGKSSGYVGAEFNAVGMDDAVQPSGGGGTTSRSCPVCGVANCKLSCAACSSVMYCSREHQVADWRRHKKDCRRLQLSSLSIRD